MSALASTSVLIYDDLLWSPSATATSRRIEKATPMSSAGRNPDEIREAFLSEEAAAVASVRRWVGEYVQARWKLADPEAAVQEIVLELVRMGRAGRIRGNTKFRSFVLTVARHNCIDAFRRQRVRETVDPGEAFFESCRAPDADPEVESHRRERLEQARFVIQGLDPACRELLGRFFGSDRKAAQIGDELGITAGNVRVRVHRCVERARELRRRFFPGGATGEAP